MYTPSTPSVYGSEPDNDARCSPLQTCRLRQMALVSTAPVDEKSSGQTRISIPSLKLDITHVAAKMPLCSAPNGNCPSLEADLTTSDSIARPKVPLPVPRKWVPVTHTLAKSKASAGKWLGQSAVWQLGAKIRFDI